MMWFSLTRAISGPYRWHLLFSYLACILAVFNSGVACIYPIVSDFLLTHFNLTQPQVGAIAITSQIGESLHLPAAMAMDSIGPKWTLTLGLIVSSAGWFLTWWSSLLPWYSQPNFMYLSIYFFLTAYSRTFCYCAGFVTMLTNCPSKHRAKVTAFLDGLFEVAVVFNLAIYRGGFLRGEVEGSAQDNSHFLFFILLFSTSLYLISTPLIRVFKREDCTDSLVDKDGHVKATSEEKKGKPDQEKTAFLEHLQIKNAGPTAQLVFSLEYQMLLWGTALLTAVCHFVLFNIAAVTRTLQIVHLQRYLLALFKAGIVISRILFGVLFDKVSGSKLTYFMLIVFASMGVLSQTLFLIPVCADYLLPVAYFLSGVIEGAVYLAVAVVVMELYGLNHLGRNISIIYTTKMVTNVILQVIHDMTRSPGTTPCLGIQCLLPGFLTNLSLALFATFCCIVLALRISKALRKKNAFK